MTVYLDASVAVSLFVSDAHSDRARAWLARAEATVVSRWTIAEFSSALSRLRKMAVIDGSEHQAAELAFDTWITLLGPPVAITEDDLIEARYLCRENASIRTPDALHIGVVRRMGLELATFDREQAETAKRYGVVVVDL
ncbi:PIN domain-containing protein [Pseudomonas sp. ODNR1LW]|nr:PIN domain-containing protein [Pseudomonas sp. ODNR1LW]